MNRPLERKREGLDEETYRAASAPLVEAGPGVTGEDDESFDVLVEHRLGRQGLHVKLDRGFEEGTYCVYVQFDDLAAKVGFTAARRQAGEYCSLLRAELDRCSRHQLGGTEDPSRASDAPRKRDLELTYLTFPVFTDDGRSHDQDLKREFQLALLRTAQQWDQRQAGEDSQRRAGRRDAFRLRLGALLAGDRYAHVDETTKQRLLDEVPPLAFPPPSRAL
jgi:hypothetical protein